MMCKFQWRLNDVYKNNDGKNTKTNNNGTYEYNYSNKDNNDTNDNTNATNVSNNKDDNIIIIIITFINIIMIMITFIITIITIINIIIINDIIIIMKDDTQNDDDRLDYEQRETKLK